MRARPAALARRVRLLAEPCLWCGEIVDQPRGGALGQSSRAGEWTACETREQALSAGCGRLAELRSTGTGRARDRHRREGESAA